MKYEVCRPLGLRLFPEGYFKGVRTLFAGEYVQVFPRVLAL